MHVQRSEPRPLVLCVGGNESARQAGQQSLQSEWKKQVNAREKGVRGRGAELRTLANASVVLEALTLLEKCSLVHFVYFTDSVFYYNFL